MITETKTTFDAGVAPDPDLAELWAAAIASDSHRELWLSKRRTGLTGTDAKVIDRSRPQTVRDHLRKKAEGTDATFSGNRATEWGNYRESVIIEEMEGTGFYRCGLLIQHPTCEYAIVTPDLVGVSFLGEVEGIEVKTSEGKDLDPDGPDFAGTRYLSQILWQIYVCGFARVRLIVEVHDGDWSRWNDRPQGGRDYQEGFTLTDYGPGVVSRHEYVFERTEYQAQIDALAAKARDAYAIFQEELTGVRESGPEEFTTVQALEYGAAARRYSAGMDKEKAGKEQKETAKAELLALALGADQVDAEGNMPEEPEARRGFSERFDGVLVTFTPAEPGKEGTVPDVEAAKAAEPEAWARVVKAQEELDAAMVKPKAALTAARDQWEAVQAKHTKKTKGAASKPDVRVTPPRKAK